MIFIDITMLDGIRVSIVVSIPACHAGDRGSIPRHGDFFLYLTFYQPLLP